MRKERRELPAPELEEVLLGGNRIGHDGLGAVFEAISVDGHWSAARSCVPWT